MCVEKRESERKEGSEWESIKLLEIENQLHRVLYTPIHGSVWKFGGKFESLIQEWEQSGPEKIDKVCVIDVLFLHQVLHHLPHSFKYQNLERNYFLCSLCVHVFSLEQRNQLLRSLVPNGSQLGENEN